MVHEGVQRVVLIIVGLVFVAAVIPGVMFFTRQPSVPMLMSLYVTLGVFLLAAARDPGAHRSLIAYAGWANVAHAGVMLVQEYLHAIERREMVGVVLFAIIGIVLIVVAPAKEPMKRVTAARAA
jgi:hypothetical protein